MNRRRCFAAVLAVAVLLWVAAAGAAATGPESNTGVLLDDATLWRQF